MMKIRVNRIPEEGLKEHARYDPTTMDMDRDDIHLREPFEVTASVTVAQRELIVDADISAPLQMACARCLAEFPFTMRLDAVFTYRVKPTDIVDITDDVRQEIILAYPMIPVCKPDCKGLCRSCGRNLNLDTCRCEQERAR